MTEGQERTAGAGIVNLCDGLRRLRFRNCGYPFTHLPITIQAFRGTSPPIHPVTELVEVSTHPFIHPMKLGAKPHPIALPKRRRYSAYKTLVVLGTVLLFIRLLPLAMPIRAADIAQTDQAIAFTDRNGYPLGTLLSRDQEHTSVVPLDQVSPLFVQAIIAAEDRRFYQHGAVDWWAVGRAIAEAIQAKRVVSGASTIPMQLARMLDNLPSSPAGKLQQVWQAWRIAAGMNREDILQAYVNRLPMGGNLYGVEAAARTYFGVPAKDLSLAQASLLAALPTEDRLAPCNP